jgi:arylsulfatase
MKRPNILILYTDQQRWDALGANGNDEIITPNLDALAKNGVTFTHHFVQSPVCMPSRVSMLSGQYPSTLGITHMGVPVPEDVITLPQMLKPYGYRTANIGKLHFLPHANRDHRQQYPSYGFDQLEISDEPGVYEDAYRAWVRHKAPKQMDNISVGIPPATRVWYDTMKINDSVQHLGSPATRSDFKGSIPFPTDDNLTHSAFVAEQTIDFIKQQDEQPFLCIAGFYSPHAPWVVPQKYLDQYDKDSLSIPTFPQEIDAQRPSNPSAVFSDEQLRDAKHGYYAMITEVDDYVGQILDTLKSTGRAEDTIVVFTSDHGEWLGEHLRFGKGYPADDAVSRVPLIISAPRGKRSKHVTDIVESVDIVPTLLSLVGLQILPHLQGENLANTILGDVPAEKQLALTEGNGWKCLRTPKYRYLIHSNGTEKLWALETDPEAYHNVADDPNYQSALADCRLKLVTHLLEIERPLDRTWTY